MSRSGFSDGSPNGQEAPRELNGAPAEFRYAGRAVLGMKTKEIVPRLGPQTVPIIHHENLDRVTAEALVASGVQVVINAASSSTGMYPNLGPLILARHGVYLLDGVGPKVFESVKTGEFVEVRGDGVYLKGRRIASGDHLDLDKAELGIRESREQVGDALESFAQNTVEFMRLERDILFSTLEIPDELVEEIRGRQVLVVVRGYDYRQDLAALGPYIRGMRPFIIGVDGGADAVLEAGWKPHLVFGDMDSVSDRALRAADHVLVHGYPSGLVPGMERVEQAGVEDARTLMAPGLSEDIAILVAEQCGAELIVAVGTHVGLVEFLDKGRKGASSTFLTRLKVGSLLVDAKGVSKLYPSQVSSGQLMALVMAGVVTVSAVVYASEPIAEIFRLLAIKLRLVLGI
jgi:uncharacterized membrane-anchored protein